MISFEQWFTAGYEGSKPGYKRIATIWALRHIAIGLILSLVIATPIKDVARSILIPLVGILIGLTFAWAGNAQGFIQTKELIAVSKHKKGGYVDYIFVYQLSILVVLLSSGLWFLASLDYRSFNTNILSIDIHKTPDMLKILIKSILYGTLSMAIHESWSIIKGVHYFLIMKNKVSEKQD